MAGHSKDTGFIRADTGVPQQANLDSDGNVQVNIVAGSGGGGGGGPIEDGVSTSIKATVLDYASSNPLAVRLTDTAGDYIAPSGVTATSYTGTFTNNGDAIEVNCDGMATAIVQRQSGAYTGTYDVYGRVGATYGLIPVWGVNGGVHQYAPTGSVPYYWDYANIDVAGFDGLKLVTGPPGATTVLQIDLTPAVARVRASHVKIIDTDGNSPIVSGNGLKVAIGDGANNGVFTLAADPADVGLVTKTTQLPAALGSLDALLVQFPDTYNPLVQQGAGTGDPSNGWSQNIGGPSSGLFAEVVDAAPTTEPGLVTRNIPSGTQAVSFSGTSDTNLIKVGSAAFALGLHNAAFSLPVVVAPDSTVSLGSGSLLVGKVGIDQSVPGTSNNVTTAIAQDALPTKTEGVAASLSQTLKGQLRVVQPIEQTDLLKSLSTLPFILAELRAIHLIFAAISGQHVAPEQLLPDALTLQ